MPVDRKAVLAAQPLGGALLRGTVWMVALRWFIKGLGIVSTLILVRLLLPADFGIVAMGMLVIGMVEVVFSLSVDAALIRNPKAEAQHFDTAWTIQIMQGSVIALLVYACAPLIADYLDDQRVVPVLHVLCMAVALRGFNNIGVVALRKDLNFAKEVQITIISRLLSTAITIGLAFWLRNYWALAWGMVIGNLLGVAVSFLMHPYRPRLCVARFRELWSLSAWMCVVNLGSFVSTESDRFVVGGVGSSHDLGLYTVASEVAQTPTLEVALPLARTLLPGYAKMRDEPERLRDAFLSVLGVFSLLIVPMGAGIAAVAEELVPVILGASWVETIPLIKCLAIYGAMRAIYGTTFNVLLVQGGERLMAALSWLNVLILVPVAFVAGHGLGLLGIALSKLLVGLIFAVIVFYCFMRSTAVRRTALVERLFRPIVASSVMMGVILLVPGTAIASSGGMLSLKVLIGVLVYIVTVGLLWWIAGRPQGAETWMINLVGSFRARLAERT